MNKFIIKAGLLMQAGAERMIGWTERQLTKKKDGDTAIIVGVIILLIAVMLCVFFWDTISSFFKSLTASFTSKGTSLITAIEGGVK